MEPRTESSLNLPSLSISGFRGIKQLSIPRLGRVTLLAGRNGVGKTTVLEAVRVYAARGRPNTLRELLNRREEFATAFDEEGDPEVSTDFAALFHGREFDQAKTISIGTGSRTDDLTVEMSTPSDWSSQQRQLFAGVSEDVNIRALRVRFRNKETLLPCFIPDDPRTNLVRSRYFVDWQRRRMIDDEWPTIVECESLGPGLLSNKDMARYWDNVALTQDQNLSIQALRLILGDEIDGVAVVGNGRLRQPGYGRHMVVKLQEHVRPVPLKSLGDGVTRMFGVALALANSRNGFLVIDEAENGVHYSVQRDFWYMVLRAACEGNVQVLATTHSWDCIKGFARAVGDLDQGDGLIGHLVRLERDGEALRAVDYSKEELAAAADQEIEVR